MAMCTCHPDKTLCPDMICVDFEDDVPIFARRDSPEGIAMAKAVDVATERRERAELNRLKVKYESAQDDGPADNWAAEDYASRFDAKCR